MTLRWPALRSCSVELPGSGDTAQWLRTCTALPEDLNLAPSTYIKWLTTFSNPSYKGSSATFWVLWHLSSHGCPHMHTHLQPPPHIHIHPLDVGAGAGSTCDLARARLWQVIFKILLLPQRPRAGECHLTPAHTVLVLRPRREESRILLRPWKCLGLCSSLSW